MAQFLTRYLVSVSACYSRIVKTVSCSRRIVTGVFLAPAELLNRCRILQNCETGVRHRTHSFGGVCADTRYLVEYWVGRFGQTIASMIALQQRYTMPKQPWQFRDDPGRMAQAPRGVVNTALRHRGRKQPLVSTRYVRNWRGFSAAPSPPTTLECSWSIQSFSCIFYKKTKNVRCEYDRLNG